VGTRADPGKGAEPALFWAHALKASIHYYERLGRLALDCGAVLASTAGVTVSRLRTPVIGDTALLARRSDDSAVPGVERTVLVEATPGRTGVGVFLVQNATREPVSAPISISPFASPAGQEVRPVVKLFPHEVSLEPGDQLLVRVAVAIDAEFEPDTRYQAELSIPGLPSVRVPLVVVRRPDADDG